MLIIAIVDFMLPSEMKFNGSMVFDYVLRPGFKASCIAPDRTMAATSSTYCVKGSDLLK